MFLTFLAACAGTAGTGAGVVRSDSPAITLQRTSCFGRCPIYRLAIYADGTVVYEGEQFVRETGRRTATIDPDSVRRLIAEAEAAGYFSLNERYDDDMMTDQPWANTSITADGKTKTIHHYQGDPAAPPALTTLEERIDEVAGSARWVDYP